MTRSWGPLATRAARRVVVALVLLAASGAIAGAPASAVTDGPRPAGARPRPATPPPPPGWDATRVRFEPLDGTPVPLTLAGHGPYRGVIEVTRNGGSVAAIDDLPLEDYVRGIAEVPTNWPLEAQKAQAIAARTYAVWSARQQVNAAYKNIGADICATDACQVYAGLTRELRDDRATNWIAAVDQTRGQVLAYRNAPIKAKYSSSNGGRSVAGDEPYLRAVDDPDDAYSPLHHWHITIPLDQIGAALSLPQTPVDVQRDGDTVRVTRPDPDPNQEPDATGNAGATTETHVAATDFRSLVDDAIPAPDGLPLTIPTMRFSLTTQDGAAVVDGGGWGHGIGMSQYGALGKALRGMKAPDILAAYYAGLRPVAAPAGWLPDRIRAAGALDDPAARITGGRFRVVADGHVLAPAASGEWTVQPRGRALRVTPPADQAGPVAVEH
ncbi:MAG TPA: SpoIID/LytB domain-containing protein, partial [Acidimicrobiales bacterium]|nr:SpoIID/LytB domain-containing protein [Acidimicrobiales bacterium]